MKYNELYTRNTKSDFWETDEAEDSCNCGSFALNLTTWFVPYLDDEEVDKIDDCKAVQYLEYERNQLMKDLFAATYDRYEVMESILERDWEFILKTCPWLEPISLEEINNSDRVIAYRLAIEDVWPPEFDPDENTDFHFRVLIDGEWWEKNGGGPIHFVGYYADEEPWEYDFLTYDSSIKYARFKEKV